MDDELYRKVKREVYGGSWAWRNPPEPLALKQQEKPRFLLRQGWRMKDDLWQEPGTGQRYGLRNAYLKAVSEWRSLSMQ